jgi:hypothetical protein
MHILSPTNTPWFARIGWWCTVTLPVVVSRFTTDQAIPSQKDKTKCGNENDHSRIPTLSILLAMTLMVFFSAHLEPALALGTISFLTFWAINVALCPKPTVLTTDVGECHELLSTTTLKKRAAPNQRLAVAFGIENGFTTTNREVHDRFRAGVKVFLDRNNNDEARAKLVELVSTSVRDTLRECGHTDQHILLVNLVRIAVFRTVMAIFFSEISPVSDKDIVFITTKMNSLWYDSKSPWEIFLAKHFSSHSSIIRDKEDLHRKLKATFPALKDSGSIKPGENTLNILLPAFMGLFRVVLSSFLEVRFRSTPQNWIQYRQLFQKFLQDPNGRWYTEENGVSVQQFVAESLRLYPPTRRIYTQQAHGIVAVDIEQLHRIGDAWGANPLVFDPKRWKREGLDVVNTVEYIPFGGKVAKPAEISRCPSRIRGGPKLIAVIVGSLLGVIDEEWSLLPAGKEDDGILGDEPLRVGRDAYESLLLCRLGSI